MLFIAYAYVEGTTLVPKVTLPASIPASPINVTVRWQGTSLLISWFPPPPRRSSVTVGCYVVEYRTLGLPCPALELGTWNRTLGHWVPLSERVAASERPSYRWTTASRSAIYQFRVFSLAAPCRPDLEPVRSLASHVVTFHTSGLANQSSSSSFIA